jgi:hypothetical protein
MWIDVNERCIGRPADKGKLRDSEIKLSHQTSAVRSWRLSTWATLRSGTYLKIRKWNRIMLKMAVFWEVAPYSQMKLPKFQRWLVPPSSGRWVPHHSSPWWWRQQAPLNSCDTAVKFDQTAHHNIGEDILIFAAFRNWYLTRTTLS